MLVCFSFLLGVAEFCMNKISMELCGFVCGFCIFVRLIREFLCILLFYGCLLVFEVALIEMQLTVC